MGLFCQSVSNPAAKFSILVRVSFNTGQRCPFRESTAAEIVRAYNFARGAIFRYIGDEERDASRFWRNLPS